MSRVFLLLIFGVAIVKAIIVCGPHEVAKDGIDCTSDCCPQPAGEPSPCSDPCAKACKCAFNYLRAANGTCIPARECPPIPCGDNEYYETCPTLCSEACSNASPDGKRCRTIGVIGIVVECKPTCRCIDNYWKNSDDQCVTYDECQEDCK